MPCSVILFLHISFHSPFPYSSSSLLSLPIFFWRHLYYFAIFSTIVYPYFYPFLLLFLLLPLFPILSASSLLTTSSFLLHTYFTFSSFFLSFLPSAFSYILCHLFSNFPLSFPLQNYLTSSFSFLPVPLSFYFFHWSYFPPIFFLPFLPSSFSSFCSLFISFLLLLSYFP